MTAQGSFDRFTGMLEQWPLSENIYEVAEVNRPCSYRRHGRTGVGPVGNDATELFKVRHQMNDIAFKAMMMSAKPVYKSQQPR